MSQSLYTAMSGISAATTDLEVISNNVANVNTTAFKSSSVNFSDVYSRTISYGSIASGSTGGTNPVQVGVGTKVSSIAKNFTNGSSTSTGLSTDLMIQGSGFFAVKGSEGSTYYTRAGDFTWDDSGNLVTSDGYKVLGASSLVSPSGSGKTVYVPTSIVSIVQGNANIGSKSASDLNGVSKQITSGDFTITAKTAATGSEHAYTINLSSTDLAGSVDNMLKSINDQLHAQTPTGSDITATCANGTISFGITTSAVSSLTFGETGDTSNFLTQTNLGKASLTNNQYTSKVLDYTCTITDVASSQEPTSVSSIAINANGSIQATYASGDVLSVKLGADKSTYEFQYTTSEGVSISGNSLNVSSTVADPANFVIQMATITNTDGLISEGSNLFKAGPNCGNITYTVGGEMGAGAIKSGYLEASNVDLSDELSKMILAQRAIEANSRVFTTSSDVMSTIVNMGR